MSVINLFKDLKIDQDDGSSLSAFVPKQTARILVIGSTGAGKTNTVLNIIMRHWVFDFLVVRAKNIDKPDWQVAKKYFEKHEQKTGEKQTEWENHLNDLPEPGDLDPESRLVFITDDMMDESPAEQKKIAHLFIAGRKAGISCISIVQSLFGVNTTVRRNVTDYILMGGKPNGKKLDTRALETVWENDCTDLTWQEFRDLYDSCAEIEYGFLYINLRAKNIYQKYCFKFQNYFNPRVLKEYYAERGIKVKGKK